jgi:hypothetical protein
MTRRTRVPRPDPLQLEIEGEVFRRELEAEAERDLLRNPARLRYGRAGDPDVHRQRRPQQARPREATP